ncbi:ABC transporter permease [Vibrio albus]|uniref:ABC transporter permease n=1 Tax=Vibrio albus TaxID=2200953 RepID=A0A2U3B602_9VIBR|nr:FtsX-like permease family protein [Vibrio albus]PWI32219.1 ABC transporter permease [Vibrio albus]
MTKFGNSSGDNVTKKGLSANRRMLRWSIEEIKHGQLWPISIALTLIIACVFALSALGERMEQVITKQGRDALTADLVFSSSNPVPQTLFRAVNETELLSASRVRFSSMAFSDTEMQLVEVKAVNSQYPLVGSLQLKSPGGVVSHVSPGELWLDERLFPLLGVSSGDVVTIGDAELTISGSIIQEPGLSFNPFRQMPAVYIHETDINKTGAMRPGGRVRFNLYLTGDSEVLEHLKESVTLTPSDRWRDQESTSRRNDMFEKTQQYLSLTVAIVIIMAAITLVLTSQHYVFGRRQTIAMLKSMGASKKWLSRWLLIQVSLLFIVGTVFGTIGGIGLEYLLRIPLTDLLPDPLPGYGGTPALISVITCLLIGVPALGIPLITLLNTSALNVMQKGSDKRNIRVYSLILVPLIPLFLVYWNNSFVWIVLTGMLGVLIFLAGLSIIIIKAIKYFSVSAPMKLAISRISRSPLTSGIQFSALSLSLMLLSVIWLVRTDLLDDWQRVIPDDAPNVFSINIAPYEIADYMQALDSYRLLRSQAYPMIRGRLTSINGDDVNTLYDNPRDIDSLSRELNLTYGTSIPERNTVLRGNWTESDGVSVEEGVADELGLSVGDRLGFTINSQLVSATINSVRHVEWREMRPNFYFQFTPDVLDTLPSTWLVSFRVENDKRGLMKQLSRRFPTVSQLDVRVMGDKIQTLLGQIIWSVTVLAALGVIAGLLLIFTLLRLSLSQRQEEIRLYRTLGASKKRITYTIWSEYGLMALIAGVIASVGADLCVAAIMSLGFDLEWSLHPLMWVLLPLLAFVILWGALNSLFSQLLYPVR